MVSLVLNDKAGERKLLVLGIEERNTERLKEGFPIHVKGERLGLNVDVVIYYGTTMSAVLDELRAAGINVPETREPTPENPVVMVKPGGPK